jgi:hypothetical protein
VVIGQLNKGQEVDINLTFVEPISVHQNQFCYNFNSFAAYEADIPIELSLRIEQSSNISHFSSPAYFQIEKDGL